jgi:hypothetical protein
MNLQETSGIGITSDNIYYVNYDSGLNKTLVDFTLKSPASVHQFALSF